MCLRCSSQSTTVIINLRIYCAATLESLRCVITAVVNRLTACCIGEVSGYMYSCVRGHLLLRTRRCSRKASGVHLYHSISSIKAGPCLKPRACIFLAWLEANHPQSSSVSASLRADGHAQGANGLFHGCWDLNSGPHSCTASILLDRSLEISSSENCVYAHQA